MMLLSLFLNRLYISVCICFLDFVIVAITVIFPTGAILFREKYLSSSMIEYMPRLDCQLVLSSCVSHNFMR